MCSSSSIHSLTNLPFCPCHSLTGIAKLLRQPRTKERTGCPICDLASTLAFLEVLQVTRNARIDQVHFMMSQVTGRAVSRGLLNAPIMILYKSHKLRLEAAAVAPFPHINSVSSRQLGSVRQFELFDVRHLQNYTNLRLSLQKTFEMKTVHSAPLHLHMVP